MNLARMESRSSWSHSYRLRTTCAGGSDKVQAASRRHPWRYRRYVEDNRPRIRRPEGLAQAKIALEFAASTSTGVQQTTRRVIAGSSADIEAIASKAISTSALPVPGVGTKTEQQQPAPEWFALRPGLWGMSIDLKEAYRRLRRRFVG